MAWYISFMDRNTVLTTGQAQEAVNALGLAHTPDLAQRRRVARWGRHGGPDYSVSKTGRVSYRWGDVLDWVERTYRNRVQCDLSHTRLGRWILDHHLTVPTFASRVNLSPHTVYKLVGHKQNERTPDASVLELVALETDIPVGALVEDAIGVNKPTHHGGDDGKSTRAA